MEACHHCGTVLPTTPGARYCPNCGEMSARFQAAGSDPSQAYAAVGAVGHAGPGAPPDSGMTWSLPSQDDPTQAIPTQSAPPEPDPYAHLYRPEGAPARANPNATQVMPPVPADFGRSDYQQPAYDQPIDYQSAGGGGYEQPYDDGYADDYPGEPAHGPRSSRGAKIGIGVAAGSVVVIVISLITLGGHSSPPAAAPAGTQGTVITPTGTPSSAPATTAAPTSSSPSSSASSPSHVPGALQLGDTGSEVKWLQTRLRQLGLYKGSINSKFDQATQTAVAAFQAKTHASDPSGVVGRSTKTALIAAGSKPTLTMAQMVGLPGGDHHHKTSATDVKRLQQSLSTALNKSVKATGQFDVDTFAAVVEYQSALGMPADGVVNGTVWAALQQGRITH